MSTAHAYGAPAASDPLIPLQIERREVGPKDVAIDIHFCGICHSDIHHARGEWGRINYPTVPGHEIAGLVTAVEQVGVLLAQHFPADAEAADVDELPNRPVFM